MVNYFLWFVTMALSIARIASFNGPFYQALAHLFVGGLIGAWLIGNKRSYLTMGAFLTLIEVAVAFTQFVLNKKIVGDF